MSYLTRIFSTGAVRKTPNTIIERMAAAVTLQEQSIILEFGAGKGEITEKVFSKKGELKIHYHAFELSHDFAAQLRKDFPGITIFRENAFAFREHLPKSLKADHIICSIPLSFYGSRAAGKLATDMKEVLNKGGRIQILFHAIWLIPVLKRALPGSKLTTFATLPPYFLIDYTEQD